MWLRNKGRYATVAFAYVLDAIAKTVIIAEPNVFRIQSRIPENVFRQMKSIGFDTSDFRVFQVCQRISPYLNKKAAILFFINQTLLRWLTDTCLDWKHKLFYVAAKTEQNMCHLFPWNCWRCSNSKYLVFFIFNCCVNSFNQLIKCKVFLSLTAYHSR